MTQDPFNAFVRPDQTVDFPAQTGPLSGARLAVKDIYAVKGLRTGCGNPDILAAAEPEAASASAVQKLIEASARFVGKTQTDELAFSLMGQNAHFPFPVNPAAPDRVSGGSSSGSAVAVAGGLADIALGSDTGGSIRAPASFCGLIGLRVTHGAIPLDGVMKLAPSLDTVGWFARDIDLYERVATVLLPLAGTGVSATPTRLLRLAELDALLAGPDEAAEYERMIARISAALDVEVHTAPALASGVDERYWAFRKIQAHEAWGEHGSWIAAGDRALGPGVADRFAYGATVTAADYEAETAVRNAFRTELRDRLSDGGLLVLPTVPGAAPRIQSTHDALQAYRERALRLLCLSGLSGFPQITLPLGTVDGAPFGISLIAPAGAEGALIALAKRILQK